MTLYLDPNYDNNLYLLIESKHVQNLMRYEWFHEECVFHKSVNNENQSEGSYFVPLLRLLSANEPGK